MHILIWFLHKLTTRGTACFRPAAAPDRQGWAANGAAPVVRGKAPSGESGVGDMVPPPHSRTPHLIMKSVEGCTGRKLTLGLAQMWVTAFDATNV